MLGLFNKRRKIWEQMGSLARIPKISFTGTFTSSPNGKFHIAVMDGDGIGRAGRRRKERGRYVLFTDHKIVATGKLERPNFPAVADNGTFCIQDWMFDTRKSHLQGTFYVFSRKGKRLAKRYFKANLMNSAISADGKYAAVATAASPKEKDSATLEIFELPRGKAVFSEQVGLVNSMAFNSETGNLKITVSAVGDLLFDPRAGKQL